jgi:phage tail tape-measure protein
LGHQSGFNLTTGDNNIDIGNMGVAGEGNTIRIGNSAVQSATFIAGISGVDMSSGNPVFIDANGQLGIGSATGSGWPTGSILEMETGSTPPAGFTKIGSEAHKLIGAKGQVIWDVYRKD